MQSMEPQRVEIKDVFCWLKQAFELVNRKMLAYLTTVTLFFVILFSSSQVIVSVHEFTSPVILILAFLAASAFVFYFILAGLVMVSHSSDHSHTVNFGMMFRNFLPSQKDFFKMSALAILIGVFYWYISVLFNPVHNLFSASEEILKILTNETTLTYYLFKIGAIFLYLLILVMFTLRTFFSVPLVLFHDLEYREAQKLSHCAIILNIHVMSSVLMIWIVLFMLTLKFVPVLAVFFLPLFAAFIYVSYRHIFLRKSDNLKATAVKEAMLLSRG